jgi:hypothetical protein
MHAVGAEAHDAPAPVSRERDEGIRAELGRPGHHAMIDAVAAPPGDEVVPCLGLDLLQPARLAAVEDDLPGLAPLRDTDLVAVPGRPHEIGGRDAVTL